MNLSTYSIVFVIKLDECPQPMIIRRMKELCNISKTEKINFNDT